MTWITQTPFLATQRYAGRLWRRESVYVWCCIVHWKVCQEPADGRVFPQDSARPTPFHNVAVRHSRTVVRQILLSTGSLRRKIQVK